MTRTDVLVPSGFAAAFGAIMLAAGPMAGIGAVLGLFIAGIIFLEPVVGVGFMILSGTALQVLGSEHITGLPASLGKLFGALTLMIWIARSLMDRTPLTYSPQMVALVAFGAAMTIGVFISPDRGLAMVGLFRYAQLYLLFFMIANISGMSRNALDATCIALTACMALSGIIGLMEFFLPSLALESDDPELKEGALGAIIDRESLEGVVIKRITGGLSDSNWFAYTLVGALPVNLYLWRRYTNWLARGCIAAAMALQSVGIVLSYTRSALIGVAVSIAYLIFKRRIALAPVVACLAIGAVGLLIWQPPGVKRVFSSEYLEEGSTPLRKHMVLGGLALMREAPILGHGYSQFGPNFREWLSHQQLPERLVDWEKDFNRLVDSGQEQVENLSVHNLVLQIGVEFGLAGLIPFFLFYWFMLRDCRLAERIGTPLQQDLAVCLYAAVLGYLVCGLFGHNALIKIGWILGGLAAALRRIVIVGETVSQPPTDPAVAAEAAR